MGSRYIKLIKSALQWFVLIGLFLFICFIAVRVAMAQTKEDEADPLTHHSIGLGIHSIDPIITRGVDTTINIKTDASTSVSLDSTESKEKLPIQEKTDPLKIAQQMTIDLQNKLDTRTLITDLAKDDPDREKNPARPDLFWDGEYLVGRSVLVTVKWNGESYEVICEMPR